MFIIDTNVLIELRKAKAGKANANVATWASAHDPKSLFLSAITLLELEIGIRLTEQRDSAQGAIMRVWMATRVLPAFEGRILPIDGTVAICCAALHVTDHRNYRDAMIAATGINNDMAIVTGNVAAFKATGVRIINPWRPNLNGSH